MLTIALDAMGGDHAPKAEVEGAVRAAGSLGVKVLLVGQQVIAAAQDARAEADHETLTALHVINVQQLQILEALERIRQPQSPG